MQLGHTEEEILITLLALQRSSSQSLGACDCRCLHHPIAMRKRLCLLFIFLRAFIVSSWAGYGGQIPIGGGAGLGKPVDQTANISDAEVDRLRSFVRNVNGVNANPFAGLNRADAQTKVRELRATLLKLIPIIRCENPKIAACIQKALETNRICIDIARPFAAASIQADDLPTCGIEPINIGILSVPCTTDVCSLEVFRLASLLLHEGLHGIQDWRGTSRANRMKIFHTREEEASLLQVRTACELIDALNAVAQGMSVPPNTPKFAAKFAKAVAAKANAAGVATALAAQIKPSKDFWEATALCRRIYKIAYGLFEDGVIDRARLNAIIRKSRWFRTYGAVAGLGTFSLTYLVTSPAEIIDGDLILQGPRMFEQIPGNGSDPVSWALPVFDEFYGGQMDATGTVIYFAGGDTTTGDGILFSYQDTNADGIFEVETYQELVRSNELFGTFDFAVHPLSGELFGFNPSLGNFELFRFADLNDDDFPDQLESIGNFAPVDSDGLGADIISIGFSADGNTLFGAAEEDPEGDTALSSFWSYAVATYNPTLDFYIPQADFQPALQSPFVPAFAIAPRQNGQILFLNGPPGHLLQVYSLENSTTPQFVGQGELRNDGHGEIELVSPPASPLLIVDPVTGLTSPPQELFPPEPEELSSSQIPLGGGEIGFFLDWPSGHTLKFSIDLLNFTPLEDAPPFLWNPGEDVRSFFQTQPPALGVP